jgi:hypothetical protein
MYHPTCIYRVVVGRGSGRKFVAIEKSDPNNGATGHAEQTSAHGSCYFSRFSYPLRSYSENNSLILYSYK